MRRTFPLILITVLATSAAAQSGRRVTPPPSTPPPTQTEPQNEESAASESESSSTARLSPTSELNSLPESILNRKLQALDKGRSFRLADFAGSVLVVNLWATWCGPCRMEVPEYEEVRKDYEGQGVEFIALTVEDPRTAAERVRQFVRDFNFGFRLGWADRETAMMLMEGRNAIPQTLVIAADGRVVSHWHGYSRGRSGERLRDALERALAVE